MRRLRVPSKYRTIEQMSRIKKIGKSFLAAILESQVRRLRSRNNFKVIAVAGSVGKTSTKLAIAGVIGLHQSVRWQVGNYNDRVTVPLVVFGHSEPSIFNITAWLGILVANERALRRPYAYDAVVVELGTDGPGQMVQFAYLRPDITVLTAITAEHMEYFGELDAVAKEELAVAAYSDTLVCNVDDIDGRYRKDMSYTGYGCSESAAYRIKRHGKTADWRQTISVHTPHGVVNATIQLTGLPGAKSVGAAIAVASLLGIPIEAIAESVAQLQPAPGRMRIFSGVQGSTIIDDTYNASPIAVTAALDVLYAAPAVQRIAVLGSMNEMGTASQAMHEAIGSYCDSSKVDHIITIGQMAHDWLAPAATAAGCAVTSTQSPYAAARALQKILKPGALILAKGSQNGVFAEEAIRPILKRRDDAAHLVRQSASWQHIKRSQFSDYVE
jgi:UDP-N-acetylmuramoyl-tripeptide--D-alanyl-D-alanine ligase